MHNSKSSLLQKRQAAKVKGTRARIGSIKIRRDHSVTIITVTPSTSIYSKTTVINESSVIPQSSIVVTMVPSSSNANSDLAAPPTSITRTKETSTDQFQTLQYWEPIHHDKSSSGSVSIIVATAIGVLFFIIIGIFLVLLIKQRTRIRKTNQQSESVTIGEGPSLDPEFVSGNSARGERLDLRR
ncbi:hypothetical protein TWF569_009672 [Orbilia oligospora]|uniref:Uncharacterized protein n=1 Tax=Orbilia oligospora TaxID=2813651 RepID=A0A7C8JA27_ORBOL|nr:hypothetical protein TWF706_001042 [Orbilia oligospora]KAF3096429.1 hypothetical protein TWF102_006700 [Orbilia oligospora]KAF3101454.1 hypothetical protein TWF103_008017 [Orbilia oligospora]KAF3130230.1 hypothetical protein TWF594_010468 [Orbilia oligospora]KAF3135740.1 hypothetical protein TWF569_009672 [Orbilia oligospora]